MSTCCPEKHLVRLTVDPATHHCRLLAAELAQAITSIAGSPRPSIWTPILSEQASLPGNPSACACRAGFVRRMTRGNPRDPLLLQVLPAAQELIGQKGFVADPLGELHDMRQPGVLQKYRGRALLLASGACAVHCRYCFRREFPYATAGMAAGETANALAAIAADTSVNEVILSGGDPLTLSNVRLGTLLKALDGIAHVRRIRIHTRLPVVLPERVDDGLITTLRETSSRLIVVLHSNHARELDDSVAAAVAALAQVPALVLNQSVLLRHVNDDSDTLAALSERLFDLGVQPYYIHQLDPVRGAAHFRVSDAAHGSSSAKSLQNYPDIWCRDWPVSVATRQQRRFSHRHYIINAGSHNQTRLT